MSEVNQTIVGYAALTALFFGVPLASALSASIAAALLREHHLARFSARAPYIAKRWRIANPFKLAIYLLIGASAKAAERPAAQKLESFLSRFRIGSLSRILAEWHRRWQTPPARIVLANTWRVALPATLACLYGAIAFALPISAFHVALINLTNAPTLGFFDIAVPTLFLGATASIQLFFYSIGRLFYSPTNDTLASLARTPRKITPLGLMNSAIRVTVARYSFIIWIMSAVIPVYYLMLVAGHPSISTSSTLTSSSITKNIYLWLPLSFFGAFAGRQIIRRKIAATRVIVAVYDYTAAASANLEKAHGLLDPIEESLGKNREALAELAGKLDYLSRYLAPGTYRGFSVHPVTLIARSIARNIRDFLQNRKSLDAKSSEEINSSLESLAICLAGPVDKSALGRLADEVGAYDEEGAPAEDVKDHPPSRARILTQSFIAQTIDSDRPAKLKEVVTLLAAIALGVYVFVTNGDITQLKEVFISK